MPVRVALFALTFVILAVPAAALFGADDLRYDFKMTGTVTELSYEIGDFVLSDRLGDYIVLADAATVQLNKGQFGTLRHLKDRALVRVFGERLSQRTVFAKTIIVLEDTGKYVDLSLTLPRYAVGDSVDVEGVVTHVSVSANEINFHSSGQNYVIYPRYDTVISRGSFLTDLYGVFRGDRIRVSGRIVAPGEVDADRIRITESCCFDGGYIDRFWNVRTDVIIGIIITIPSRPMWTFNVRTPFGVRVARLAVPASGRQLASIQGLQDLKIGANVQLTGFWDCRTLVANRFAVTVPQEPKKNGEDKPTGKQATPSRPMPKSTTPADPKADTTPPVNSAN